MVKHLIIAKNWAGGIRDCLSKVENWSSHRSCDLERVPLENISELLNFDPMPCNEPGHLILKVINCIQCVFFFLPVLSSNAITPYGLFNAGACR